MPTHPPSRLIAVLALVSMAGGILVACGDDDDVSVAPVGTAEAAEDTAPDDDAPGDLADEPASIDIEMVDYEYTGVPERAAVGVTLRVSNRSEGELHEIVALRLPDDEERSLDQLVELPPDEAAAAVGGPPVAVLLAAPGGPQITAVGDGTLSEPGRYALVCMIPAGADPDEYLAAEASPGPPQVDGGPPHLVLGMFAELLVE